MMEPMDHLARKLIHSFEYLEEHLILEQVAVPEDLQDPNGSVELWIASNKVYSVEEEIVVRGHLTLPTSVAMERDAKGLARLFKEELLASEPFRHATVVADVAGKAANEGGVPSTEEARLN